MHARNRTWALGSDPAERCRQRTMPVEGGDGSTLSLDFTTGVLDPRLTFTRGSNATFINSSGLVTYANHNLWYNTAFDGISGTNPTLTNVGWSYAFSAANSSATFNGDGTVTISATASRRALQRISGFGGSGRRMIVSVDILTSGDTGLVPTQILRDGSLLNSAYFIDGSPYVSGNVFGPCTLSYVCDAPTPGTFTPYFGVGTSGNSTGTVTFTNPRMGLFGGVAPLPYYANTSSGASPSERHDARFDYDPTTIGSPRGLLIESAATNICTYSGDLTQSGAGHWSVRTALITTSWTGFTAPDGTATAVKIIPDTSSSRHTIESSSTAVVSGTTYTASAFVKADGYSVASIVIAGGQTRRNFTLSGSGTVGSQFGVTNTATITPVGSNGWYRITMTWTANATGGAGLWIGVPQNATTDVVSSWSGNGTSAIQAWGAQLEEGSGASSYIPTGASQGSRSADECLMDSTNFAIGSWYTAAQGTFYTDVEYTALSGNQSGIQLSDNSGGSETNRLSIRRSIAIATRGGTTARQFTPTATARAKSAFAYGTADYRFSQNGATFSAIAGDNGAPPSSIDRLRMFLPGPTQIYGWVRAIKFWPVSQSQAFINARTTL